MQKNKVGATTHQYPPAPQPPSIYFHPLYCPHHSRPQSYCTKYMSSPYYSEPRCHNPYYEASFPVSSDLLRPVQTISWKQISLVRPPQQDGILHKSNPKAVTSKHVHFELPASQPSTSRTRSTGTEEARDMPGQKYRKREKETLHPSSRLLISSQGREDYISRAQYPSMRSCPKPTQPTIYIITYAADLIRCESSTATLLASQVPLREPPIRHLYTIDARNIRPPPPALCDAYSGISRAVQDAVMQDPSARMAVRTAVKELLRFGDEARSNREKGRRGSGANMEVSMSVCCHAGTHRSVAIAERIAQCVKREVARLGCEEGVRVVCRHVHRVKGWADPF